MALRKASQSHRKTFASRTSTVKLEATIQSSSQKRLDPLTAFKTPGSSLNNDTCPILSQQKGKEKENLKPETRNLINKVHDDRMWVDIYEPMTEAELAVHKKKVQDVRTWLTEAFSGGPSGKPVKCRRLLALTGPAGTAKTTTIRVLSREMDFEILEWRSAADEVSYFDEVLRSGDRTLTTESLFTKFESFLNRASSCQNIFSSTKAVSSLSQFDSGSQHQSQPSSKRRLILLDDLPNILHPGIQAQFHSALQSLVASASSTVPTVIIVSDAGTRGEESDERLANGSWGRGNDVLDIRTVIPRDLLHGPYVTQINFNPISPTLLTKALKNLLSVHYASSPHLPLSKNALDAIIDTSNGDIRSAIMALQFACSVQTSDGKAQKKREVNKSFLLESVTRREQTLALFHLVGKVLYNKRKGDPHNASATARDIQHEKQLDEQLKDPFKLSQDLQTHERRCSRVDVNALYSDSPIDSSLFSLYIHQNYPQFCDGIEHCDGVADWLSWVDCSGGEAWYQANPYRFHLLTLGTLHTLPSPVQRRSQKVFKPAFFDYLQKGKSAWDGARDVQNWVSGEGTSQQPSVSNWSQVSVAVELGGVLKALDVNTGMSRPRPPPSHRLFSHMTFVYLRLSAAGVGEIVDERDVGTLETGEDNGTLPEVHSKREDVSSWLEEDDIQDF